MKSKVPYLGEDDIIHFKKGEETEKDGIYVAVASFITSYARLKTISSAQKITDNYNQGKSKAQWVYSDTDSNHILLNGEDEKTFLENCGLEIDDTKLGAWKFEGKFRKAKYLRQKCYIEEFTEDVENPNPEYNLKITVAGMPKNCYDQVTFKNFKLGARYKGKLIPKNVKNGTVLLPIDFTIKE